MVEIQPERHGLPWEHDELVLAFDLYCRIPFQKTKANNPRVQELASLLRRSPASIARKLGNFGAFDPILNSQGISGLSHGSKMDRQVWDEFHADWNALVYQAETVCDHITPTSAIAANHRSPSGPTEKIAQRKVRVQQGFFREAVLSSYNRTCCVTGITIQECLIAGHIIPWRADESQRTNPCNGLCLSATFDRLFDTGLMTISEQLTVEFAEDLTSRCARTDQELLLSFSGRRIRSPERFAPDHDSLAWHRDNVFCGG